MIYRISILFFIASAFIIFSCNEDTFVIPKPCSGDITSYIRSATLQLGTEITSNDIITVSTTGFLSGDSIRIQQDNVKRTASVKGQMCSSAEATIIVNYTDTTDNSGLKIDCHNNNSTLTGEIYYCANINNCSYTQIGHLTGIYSDHFQGNFYTPLFLGWFSVYLYR